MSAASPVVDQARTFLDGAEARLLALSVDASRASWVHSTYITDDTEILSAQASEKLIAASVELVKSASRFDGAALPEDLARKLRLLKNSLTMAAPSDPAESQELTRIAASLEGTYGKGEYCPPGTDKCLDLEDITKIMAESRDARQLLDVWAGWHSIAPVMRQPFERYVALANKGAREIGFADTGAMWRSKYDMPPDAFARELDRLWSEVRPLYVSLHAYVRWKLREKYGAVVPADGPIPAHLLGNVWAQDWRNLRTLLAPAGGDPGVDLTSILKSRDTSPVQMVRYGEGFFRSLGFDPLPKTFWERSLFVKPLDRDVVFHASAWDVDAVDDLRIKMCIDITAEAFTTIHHELGHNFYQRAYNTQPYFFRDGANDGFHEAIGDTIALSVTPEYLVKLGLLDKAPDHSRDIGLLLDRALDKIAFLPFAFLVDAWRWKVFSGEIPPSDYNKTWWELRRKYQGVAPAVSRSEKDFDPAAKYHVAAGVPYTRYFLAAILEYQFHRALAREAGCAGPLHRCSIYGSAAAGGRLARMLAMGASKPWPEALAVATGSEKMDASAIREYFAPLQKWLDEQNKGKPVGW
ncbi:MAG TPA: M2 family metallopeptidase [Thermoanaerobaculia bacterium]|nr:M2 family metallopeptidase [Thermoanaerobaculia bacterium]